MNYKNLNGVRLHTNTLNAIKQDDVGSSKAYGGYVKDGLVFQLDCARNLSASKWTDLIGGKVATLTSCTTGEGVVLTSGSKVEFESVEGAVYWEVTTLNATTEEAQTTTSTTSPSPYSTAGTLYAIRAYSSALSTEQKAHNAARDTARFGTQQTRVFGDEFADEFE